MNSENWLLVGGPRHGETVWAGDDKKEVFLLADAEPGESMRDPWVCYRRETFAIRCGGREWLYNIGAFGPVEKFRARDIMKMIEEKALEPFRIS